MKTSIFKSTIIFSVLFFLFGVSYASAQSKYNCGGGKWVTYDDIIYLNTMPSLPHNFNGFSLDSPKDTIIVKNNISMRLRWNLVATLASPNGTGTWTRTGKTSTTSSKEYKQSFASSIKSEESAGIEGITAKLTTEFGFSKDQTDSYLTKSGTATKYTIPLTKGSDNVAQVRQLVTDYYTEEGVVVTYETPNFIVCTCNVDFYNNPQFILDGQKFPIPAPPKNMSYNYDSKSYDITAKTIYGLDAATKQVRVFNDRWYNKFGAQLTWVVDYSGDDDDYMEKHHSVHYEFLFNAYLKSASVIKNEWQFLGRVFTDPEKEPWAWNLNKDDFTCPDDVTGSNGGSFLRANYEKYLRGDNNGGSCDKTCISCKFPSSVSYHSNICNDDGVKCIINTPGGSQGGNGQFATILHDFKTINGGGWPSGLSTMKKEDFPHNMEIKYNWERIGTVRTPTKLGVGDTFTSGVTSSNSSTQEVSTKLGFEVKLDKAFDFLSLSASMSLSTSESHSTTIGQSLSKTTTSAYNFNYDFPSNPPTAAQLFQLNISRTITDLGKTINQNNEVILCLDNLGWGVETKEDVYLYNVETKEYLSYDGGKLKGKKGGKGTKFQFVNPNNITELNTMGPNGIVGLKLPGKKYVTLDPDGKTVKVVDKSEVVVDGYKLKEEACWKMAELSGQTYGEYITQVSQFYLKSYRDNYLDNKHTTGQEHVIECDTSGSNATWMLVKAN